MKSISVKSALERERERSASLKRRLDAAIEAELSAQRAISHLTTRLAVANGKEIGQRILLGHLIHLMNSSIVRFEMPESQEVEE